MDSSLRLFVLYILLCICILSHAQLVDQWESSNMHHRSTSGPDLRLSDSSNKQFEPWSIRGSSLRGDPATEGLNPQPDPTTAGSEPETRNVTARYCPFPCTVGNQTLCYPPPCPPPACVDPGRLQPTDCCTYCPNGNNCRAPDGSIIKYDQWKIIDGRNCTCQHVGAKTTCV